MSETVRQRDTHTHTETETETDTHTERESHAECVRVESSAVTESISWKGFRKELENDNSIPGPTFITFPGVIHRR